MEVKSGSEWKNLFGQHIIQDSLLGTNNSYNNNNNKFSHCRMLPPHLQHKMGAVQKSRLVFQNITGLVVLTGFFVLTGSFLSLDNFAT